MSDYQIIANRLAQHQAGLATLGVDPAWDKAMHAYLRADALQHAAGEFGDLAKVRYRHQVEGIDLQGKYGRDWKLHPDGKKELSRINREIHEEDERWGERYCKPMWRAANELALTPAPTIGAAMFKASIMESEEVWNDRDFPADCMEILQADFARLAREL